MAGYGNGHLQECVHTEFDWDFNRGFVKAAVSRAAHLPDKCWLKGLLDDDFYFAVLVQF